MAEHKCPYCEYETDSGRGLKRHITMKHKEEKAKAAINLENTVSLTEVAGKVDIPIDTIENLAEPPPVKQPEPVVEEPEEVIIEEPEEPKELDLKALGIVAVPVGATVKLNGDHWCKSPVTGQYETIKCEDVYCQVVNTLTQNGYTYLQLGIEGSDVEWCCLEQAVLEGQVKLLSLSKPTPIEVTPEEIIVDPPEEPVQPSEPVQEVEEASVVEAVEDPVIAVRTSPREEFHALCQEYIVARDMKNNAKKDYDLVDQANRPKIVEYLEANGQPSEAGKGDNVVVVDGVKAHWTFTPGNTRIKRDTEKIIEWCLNNGHFYVIEAALNAERWDALVDSGAVPSEFLKEVQTPVKDKDTRRLLVEKLTS